MALRNWAGHEVAELAHRYVSVALLRLHRACCMSNKNAALPWYTGSNGATTFTRHEAQRFARQIVESQDYRDSLNRRIKSDTLQSGVECMLWHYAYGKPVEQLQITLQPGQEDLSSLSLAELQDRAKAMMQQ